jgi:hypothetical protein
MEKHFLYEAYGKVLMYGARFQDPVRLARKPSQQEANPWFMAGCN